MRLPCKKEAFLIGIVFLNKTFIIVFLQSAQEGQILHF